MNDFQIPMLRELDPDTEQKILASVASNQFINNITAPPVSQEKLKQMSTDDSSMPMTTPIPNQAVNKVQQQEDKNFRQVVKDYMKKREALAKNSQDKARILGDNFQQQADLSPLAALSDSWFGGNLSRSYRRPETQAENFMKQQQLENSANQTYSSLTDDEMNLLRQEFNMDQAEQNRQLEREKMQMSGSKIKPLTGEMVKRLDNIAGMDRTLSQMKQLSIGNNEEEVKTFLSQNMSLAPDTKFGALLRNAAEYYGRMQSGGAIQQAEDKRFIMSLFKPNDSIKVRMQKYKEMEDMIRERAESISFGMDPSQLPKSLSRILDKNKGGGQKNNVSNSRDAAMNWIKANPNDPRVEAVRLKAGL